jgi:hypothetical protein
MKQLFFIAVIISLLVSCHHVTGSGNIVTEKKQVGKFSGVSAGSSFEVELRIGPSYSVEIEADDNLVKLIETKMKDGNLRIEIRHNYSIKNEHLKAYVTAPNITVVKSSGAANMKALDPLKSTHKIIFETSGAGKITAQVDAPAIEAKSSGAGNIELTGRTRDYKADASGAGSIETTNLQSENATVETSGAGNVHLHASVKLKAHASGAGNIYYRGGADVQQNVSGAGKIVKED